MKFLFPAFLAVLALSACNFKAPPPESYEGWSGPDGRPLPLMEAKKALLECGALSPRMNLLEYEKALGIPLGDRDAIINQYSFVDGCMEQAGLKKNRWSLKRTCDSQSHHADLLPACQPDAVFLERSVERRLISRHCKLMTDVEYCRKYSYAPEACGLTEREECLRRVTKPGACIPPPVCNRVTSAPRQTTKPWMCTPEWEALCRTMQARKITQCAYVKDERPPIPPECLP